MKEFTVVYHKIIQDDDKNFKTEIIKEKIKAEKSAAALKEIRKQLVKKNILTSAIYIEE